MGAAQILSRSKRRSTSSEASVHQETCLHSSEMSSKASLKSVTTEWVPMVCMTMDTLMAQKLMPSYGTLQRAGLHRRPSSDSSTTEVVHFVSHEWLSREHPDPAGTQLRCLQNVLRVIALGGAEGLFDPETWEMFSTGLSTSMLERGKRAKKGLAETDAMDDPVRRLPSNPLFNGGLTAAKFGEHVTSGLLWLDFSCIPQLCDVTCREEIEQQSEI